MTPEQIRQMDENEDRLCGILQAPAIHTGPFRLLQEHLRSRYLFVPIEISDEELQRNRPPAARREK